jgi:hypothetical protein
LALINWLPEKTPFGPPVERRLAPDQMTRMAATAGLRSEEAITGLLEMHSFLVFRKPR